MPLLNVVFPLNALTFYNFILEIASFDLMQTESINPEVFNFSDSPETEEYYSRMGFEDNNFIFNIGSMFYYMLIWLCLAASCSFLKLFTKKHRIIQNIYEKLRKVLFFNVLLRTFIEGYFELTLSSLLQVRDMTWINVSDKFSSSLSIPILLFCTLLPLIVFTLLYTRFKYLPK